MARHPVHHDVHSIALSLATVSLVLDKSLECDSTLIEILARQSGAGATVVKIPAAALTAGRSYAFRLSVVTSDGVWSEVPATSTVDVYGEDILEV